MKLTYLELAISFSQVPVDMSTPAPMSTMLIRMPEAARFAALLDVPCASPSSFSSMFRKRPNRYRHKELYLKIHKHIHAQCKIIESPHCQGLNNYQEHLEYNRDKSSEGLRLRESFSPRQAFQNIVRFFEGPISFSRLQVDRLPFERRIQHRRRRRSVQILTWAGFQALEWIVWLVRKRQT